MENDPFIVSFPIKNGDVPSFFVCLPEGKSIAESPDFDQISGPILWPGNPPEGPMKIPMT